MGIADRAYSSDGFSSRGRPGSLSGWSVNTWLIAINIAIFVVGAMVPRLGMLLVEWGHFSTARAFFSVINNQMVFGLEVWRFVTFQFLHANLMHVGFNMLGLYFFGQMVEDYLGRRRYLAFYLMCGICGGLTYLLLNLVGQAVPGLPGVLIDDPRTPLVGASAGVFGVIMACAFIAPNTTVQLLFPPIPMKMKVFAYAYTGIALVSLLLGRQNAGGEAAHVGGAIAGFVFIRNSHLLRDFFDVFGNSTLPPRSAGKPRKRGPDEAEIDRVLAKVSEKGIHSLTAAEKRVLRKASEAKQR
jgi:membrane associated rhomboid family serine protease